MRIRVFLAFLCFMPLASAQIQVSDLFTNNQFASMQFNTILPADKGFSTSSVTPQTKTEVVKVSLPLNTDTYLMAEGNATFSLYKDKNGIFVDFTAQGKESDGQVCLKDMTPKGLTQLSAVTASNSRYYAKLSDCDVFVDLQDDSVRVIGGACSKKTSCELDLNGLYRKADSLPLDDKTLDNEWRDADKRFNKARATITKKLGSTQAMRDFLSEHLDFMSQRLTQCASFGKEASWCSLRLTQIRAVELENRLTALK